MIFVTQGHEKGIGLEVFLKSFLTMDSSSDDFFTLITNQKTLEENLKFLRLNYSINGNELNLNHRKLKLILINNPRIPQSTESLEIALKLLANQKGSLITLPTSKDQLILNSKQCMGYTEYFREYFLKPELAMFFYSDNLKVLLLTDHLKLSQITSQLTENLILKKVEFALGQFNFNKIYFAGINPHAGENGLLGNEDQIISSTIKTLEKKYPHVSFHGPISGDVLHYKVNAQEKQLLVYSYHDQGLVHFKSQQSLMGINITLGLPFLRLSVDHGTGFDLYGKNQANYLGCFYTLKKALEWKI